MIQRTFFHKPSKMKLKSPKFKVLITHMKINPSSTLVYPRSFFSNRQIGYHNL